MITSASNQKVKQVVQWQKKARERRRDGVFVAEGFKLFSEAPEQAIREVYLSEHASLRLDGDEKIRDRLAVTGYEIVSDDIFRKMSDTDTPQGILCVVERPVYTLDGMLDEPAPLLAVLDGLQDPGNLGTILRTGEGAGITGVIIGKETVDIYHPKTVRATMGSIFRVPFLQVEDLPETIRIIRQRGIKTYAAHLSGKNCYGSFSFRDGCAFLIGSEGRGLSPEIAGTADHMLKIPMEGRVESLNAAVAASLLFYEAYRQRQE